jgi:hypothetical protein
LKSQHPQDETMHVSHETIYRSLFIQARGAQQSRAALVERHLRFCMLVKVPGKDTAEILLIDILLVNLALSLERSVG